ncbi:hypothetical protein LSTR_LSTR000402 [Laodelphax striatellus]|uniref:Calponin-homology (CH) domain-containing protein n=1 Tax=Laodelphax striatellus TaxID=195883 RepID=A0A482X467_LAOST|nr:hypothetical protein LSTR_LSTR000402 [Laodelphax striatellus]
MAAEVSAELGLINDEDVLRKMWQQTEDFGKKKEIRARMYKLREQRLKEFYTTDVASDIALTGRKHTATHHVDSIADQGFMSMKTKEIRDSESPTRDIHKRQAQNNYWNTVQESYSTADDGGRLVDTYEKSMSGQGVSPDGRTYSQSSANQKNQHSSNLEQTENSTKIEDQQSRSSQAVIDAHTKTDDGDVYTKASKQEEQKKSSSYATSKTGNTTYHSSSKQESKSSSSYTKQSMSSSTSNTYQILPSGERVLVSSTTVSNPRAITDETNFNSDINNLSKYQDTTDFISTSKRDNQSSSDVKTSENISNRYLGNSKFISNETADVTLKNNAEINASKTYTSESLDKNISDRRQTTQNSKTITTENESSNVVDQKIMSELHKLDSYLSTQNVTGASTPVSPNSVTGDAANWTVVSSSDGEFVYKSDKEKGPGDKPVVIKHPTSLELPKEATEGQYVTTYQQSYQPKKISVEHSPTHDAFARSLRTSPPPSSTRSSSKGSLDRSSPDRKFQKGGSPTRRSPEKERRVSVAGSYTIEKPKEVKRKVSEATYEVQKDTNVKAKRKFSTTQAKTISKVRSSTPGTSPSTSPTRMNRERSSSSSDSESDSSQLTYNKNTSTIKRASTRKSSKDQSSPERSPTRKVQSPTKSITHGRSTPETHVRPSSPSKATPSDKLSSVQSPSRKSPSPTKAKPSSTSPERASVRSPSPTKTTGILRKDSKSDSASTILIKSETTSRDNTKNNQKLEETQEITTDTFKNKTDTDSQVSEFISKIKQEEETQKNAIKSTQHKLTDTVDDLVENKNVNKMTYHTSDEITITKTNNTAEDEGVLELTTDSTFEDHQSVNKESISKDSSISREDVLLSQGVINNEVSKTETSEFIQNEKTGTSSPTTQSNFRDKSPEYSSEGSVTKEIKTARSIGKKNASTPDSSPERSAFKPIKEFRTEPELKDKMSVKVQPSKYPAGAPSPVSPKPSDKKTPSNKDQTTKPQSRESSPAKSPSRSASPVKQVKNKSPVRESKSSSVSPYSSPERSPTKKTKPTDSPKPSQAKDADKTKNVNQRTTRRSSIPRAENVTSVTRKVSEKKIELSNNKKPTARVPSFEKRVPIQKTQNVRSDSQSSITRRTVTTRSDSQSSITKKTVTKTVRSSSARDMNTTKTLNKTPSTTKVKTTAIINLQRPASNKSLPVQNSKTNAGNIVNVTVTTKRKVNESGPRKSQPIESKPQTPKQAPSKVVKKEVVQRTSQKTVHKDAYDGSSDRSSSVSSPETVKPVDVTGTKKQSTIALSLICSSNVTSKQVKSNDFKPEIDVEDLEDELPPAEFLVDDYEDDEDKPVQQMKPSVTPKTAPKTQPKPGSMSRTPAKASPAKPSTTTLQNRSTLNKRVSNESLTKTQSNKQVTAKTTVVKKDTSKQDLTVKSKANITLNNRNNVATNKGTPTPKSTPTKRPAVPPKKTLVHDEPETSSSEDEETNITENVSIITEDQQHYIDELEEIRTKEEQEYAAKLMATTNQEDSLLSVIVQHPKSSRESSPGHPAHSPFCAVSDDGGAHPRYADLISEPEDVENIEKTKLYESSSKRYEQVTNLDEESETEDLNVSVADRVSKFLATSQAVSSPKETPEKPTESPKTERKEVLKAKNMFETIAKNQTAPPAPNNKPVDILSRPSVFEGRRGVTTPKEKFDTFPKTKATKSTENLNKTASTNDLLVENSQTHVNVDIEENTSQQFIKNESTNVLKEIQIENIDLHTKSNKISTEQKQETTTRDRIRKTSSPEKETQPRKDSIKETTKKQTPGKKYPGTENKETKTLDVSNRESKISSKKDFFERKANAEKNTTLTKERPLKKEPITPAKPKKPSDSQVKTSDFIQNERKTSPSPRASPERKPVTKRAESPDTKKAQTKTVRENSATEITRKQSTERRTEIDRKSTPSPTKDRRESPRASPEKQAPTSKAKSPERSPKKESPREKSPEKVTTTSRPSSPTKKAPSPERAAPSERKSSLKRSSPERKVSVETSSTRRQSQERTVVVEGETVELNKAGRFGVTLKRTPSTASAATPRRLSTPGGEEIEDIFQLELLEQMLEKAVGYETRRRIRAQIRIVKKMIEDGEIQVTTTTTTTTSRKTTRSTKSPVKEVESKPQSKPVTDSYKKPEPKKPVEQRPTTPVQRPASPTKHRVEVSSLKSTFEQKGAETKRAPSPSKLQDQQTVTRQETVKKTTRIETSTNVRSQPREREPCPITSSYGVGPTDDEGRPLFGLKALRRSNTAKTLTDEPQPQPQEEKPNKAQTEAVDEVFDARGRPLFGLRALQVSSFDTDEMPAEVTSPQIRGLVEKHEQNARTSHKEMESKTTVVTSKSVVSSDGSVSVNREVIKGELSSRNGEEPTGKIVHSKYSYQTPDESNKSQGISSTVTTTKTIGGGRRSSGPKITEIEDSDERRSSITSSRRYSGAKVTEVEEEECERVRRSSPDECDSNLVSSVIKKFSGSKTADNDKSWQKSTVNSKFVTTSTAKKSNSTVTESKSKSYSPTSQPKVSDDDEEKTDDKKKPLIRGDSIRALQHKFQQATESAANSTPQRGYPPAGLILRTSSFKATEESPNLSSSLKQHSTSTESKQRPNRTSVTTRRNSKTDSSSVEENNFQTSAASKTVTSSVSSTSTRVATEKSSFLDNTTRVTGVQDILQRMRNADLVVESGDTDEDTEARALLNKFLGASVILQGMEQGMKAASAAAKTNGHASSLPASPTSAALVSRVEKQRIASSNTNQLSEEELENIWDEKQLRDLLEACSDYEGRRRIRARLRAVMAEQKVCADVVAVASSDTSGNSLLSQESMESKHVSTKTEGSTITHSEVRTTSSFSSHRMTKANSVTSPFAKFKQLERQNSAPSRPTDNTTPIFKFTDPKLARSASTIKDRLLYWVQAQTKEYKNIQIDNFSTSWNDGLAFCALIHHFCPEAFDYDQLTPEKRRHNFELAFRVADEEAGIAPLLDVEDMVVMRRPDWKCVFTYVQSIYRRFHASQDAAR